MKPFFSIVLVSRNRVSMLNSLLESIERTAGLDYEVLVGLDNDDFNSIQAYSNSQSEKVRFFFQDRHPNLHRYLNRLTRYVRGQYVLGLNDDCEIVNQDWDIESKKILETSYNKYYGRTNDNSIDKILDKKYASFPMISKKAIDCLGFFMEETCGNHGSDIITYNLYNKCNMVIDVPINIRHIFHENNNSLNLRFQDQTAREMIERTMQENKINNLDKINIDEYIRKLKTLND